jgi:uridine kinase
LSKPIYSFDRHTRDPTTRLVPPRPFLVLEGILALHHPKIRELLDLKIFVDTADRECLGRRLRRDIAERGRTESSVRDQYEATVRPMALEYVLPTRQYADVLVSGEQPVETSVERVLAALGRPRA